MPSTPAYVIEAYLIGRNASDERFWFAHAANKAEADTMMQSIRENFDTYLEQDGKLRDQYNLFGLEAVPLKKDDPAAQDGLVEALAELGENTKFRNFIQFLGQRPKEARFKKRKR